MVFSERIGLVTPKVIQINSMDGDLKNSLYNFIYVYIIEKRIIDLDNFNRTLIRNYYKTSISNYNQAKYVNDFYYTISFQEDYFQNEFFENSSWNQVYDIIEMLLDEVCVDIKKYIDAGYIQAEYIEEVINELNRILERENSAYRYVAGKFVPITNEIEIASIEEALKSPNKLCTEHLQRALELLSDKEKPDYRNSIKESISAVECLVKSFNDKGKGTLGALLGKMKKEGKIHASLSEGFSTIYGYTSDESGIRHSLMEDGRDVTKNEAMFMLVSCSAFVNYLQGKNNIS